MYDLEKPFHRLTHHFIARAFYGAGEGDELQFGIPALLGLLAAPSAFGAIALLNKYSTLAMFLRRLAFFDVYRASIPDEYFFICYSMAITGAVIVLRWDRLFPDKQDYDNLAVLPLSKRQIFSANLIAILFLAVLFAVDVNWAACLIFPFAVTSRYSEIYRYVEFFFAHASALLLASVFACFALLAVLGLTLLLTPQRYAQRASLIVRVLCALAIVSMLASAFTIPSRLLSAGPPAWLHYIPTVWFVGLQQSMLSEGNDPTGVGLFAIPATAAVILLAVGMYALTYYRRFMRIPERIGLASAGGRDKPSLLLRVLDAVVLSTPFERATFRFSVKTLFRSERHCLLFGCAIGGGFFFAAQALSDALATPMRPGAIDPRLLSPPLILAYFTLVSLRLLFDIPSDHRANWIFRSLLSRTAHNCRSVALKVLMSAVVPWLLLVALPIQISSWGWRTALLHTAWVFACSVLLAEVLLIGFHKIPFTCTHTASKDRILVMVIFFLLGLSVFSGMNSRFEAGLLEAPAKLLFVIPVFVVVIAWLRVRERDRRFEDRQIIFEDRPSPVLQPIDLTRER